MCSGGKKYDMKNMYLILSGFALINDHSEIYELCAPKIRSKHLGQWKEAILRTDETIRALLNLTLHCAILSYRVEQVE